jgi:hypothetical protein
VQQYKLRRSLLQIVKLYVASAFCRKRTFFFNSILSNFLKLLLK